MKKLLVKILILAMVIGIVSPVMALPNYTNMTYGVGEDWIYGEDEYWHLQLVNEKSSFEIGEKVQFFAQIGPIFEDHQWQLVLYKDGEMYKTIDNPRFYPDSYFGWNYSNFVHYEMSLPYGSYKAIYKLNLDNGFETLGTSNFTVVAPSETYIFDHATTSLGWEHGVDTDYWNLKPINIQNTFKKGDTIYLMTQLRDIYVTHRYKVELYREDSMLWDFESDWLTVDEGWKYSNFFPYYSNAQPGNYTFKIYVDTSEGYTHLADVPFTVNGVILDYVYDHTYIASNFAYGTDTDYWNLTPVDPKTTFNPGETVYALAQVKNIYVNHQWRVELFRDNDMLWDYETDWYQVGSGWTFGNFYPYYSNAQPGNYTFKIYINTGSAYTLLDEKPFNVTGTIADYQYLSSAVAADWEHGVSDEYWNIQPVDPRTTYSQGETVYVISKVKNIYVDHRWKVELYKDAHKQWEHETGILEVGNGWTYGSFYPYYLNAQPGSYQFKVYIDTGTGYELLDTKAFTVGQSNLPNIVETAVADGRFSTLVAAVQAAGLADTLSNTNNLTVFAPTNDAFAKLPVGTVESLLSDIPTLTDILTYHVNAQKLTANQVISAGTLTMLNGDTADIKVTGEDVFINDAKIVITDIYAGNGIIHAIDTVLIP